MTSGTVYEAPQACRVQDLPLRQQPREIVDQLGHDSVTDDILLALILRSGTRGVSVVDLARNLLNQHRSLTSLANLSVEELASVKGMGKVKAQVLKAALELGRRLSREKLDERPVIKGPEHVVALLGDRARSLKEEVFWILPLDVRNRLRRDPRQITRGTLTSSLVHAREVFREAILVNSACIIMAHNHPSGDPNPSADDLRVTRAMIEAGKVLGIPVLDHIVIGLPGCDHAGYFSLRESNFVEFD